MLLGNVDLNRHINIVGAGFSGLILGYFLKQKNISFTIYEQNTQVGGKIDTLIDDHAQAETGAHAFFVNQEIKSELTALGLKPIPSSKDLAKIIYRQGKLSRRFLTPLELVGMAIRFLFKRPKSVTDRTTLEDFLLPLVGQKLMEEVFCASMQGIYGADLKELNLKSIFKNVDWSQVKSYFGFMRQMKKSSLRNFESVSFDNGMGSLIGALKKDLKEHLQLEQKITTLPDNSIICTNAHEAAELLQMTHPKTSEQLRKIEYLPATGCTIITKKVISNLEGAFGALFPRRNNDRFVMGILNNYSIFPPQRKRTELNSYTLILNTSENIEQVTQEELEKLGLIEVWNKRINYFYKPWKKGLPLYNYERLSAIEEIRKSDLEDVALFGNYISGISLREMFFGAKKLTSELL